MARIVRAAGRMIDTLKLNSTSLAEREGRRYWVKRRYGWSGALSRCANVFFRITENPVLVLADIELWQRWEIESFQLLHGAEGYRVFADAGAVWAEQLPGTSLEETWLNAFVTDGMLEAAARELRRVHGLPCESLNGGWSHGDSHLGNFLFDPRTGRARLIDFDVRHSPELTEAERQADDMLVFLQDLMGRVDGTRWLPAALCFLNRYFALAGLTNSAFAILHRRLALPRGPQRMWWAIRTGYLSEPERTRRIRALRAALAKMKMGSGNIS